jgi:hypothetical protein
MTRKRPAGFPVDELAQNRHETCARADVESPSRAAGGFPTQGGGVRELSRTDVLAALVSAAGDAVGVTDGGA